MWINYNALIGSLVFKTETFYSDAGKQFFLDFINLTNSSNHIFWEAVKYGNISVCETVLDDFVQTVLEDVLFTNVNWIAFVTFFLHDTNK